MLLSMLSKTYLSLHGGIKAKTKPKSETIKMSRNKFDVILLSMAIFNISLLLLNRIFVVG